MGVPSGPTSVCASSTQTYSVTFIPGHTYSWTVTGGTIISGQSTPSISVQWGTGATGNVQNTENGIPNSISITIHALPVANSITGSSSVCAGNTVNYDTIPVGGATYAWTVTGGTISGSSTGTTITVVWGSAGSGNVSLVINNGTCSSASVNEAVTINAVPSTPDISGSSSVCNGQQATYTTTSHSGYTYSWAVSGGTISGSSTGTSVSITWNTVGTGVVSLVVNNGSCDSSTASQNVTVNALPSTPDITGTSSVCNGQQSTFTTTSHAGYTYSWSVTGGTISGSSTGTSVTINWTTAGTGVVSLVVNNGTCDSNTATQNVTVNALPSTPDISGSTSVCNGHQATYTTTSHSGYMYSWSVTGGTISGSSTGTSVTITWNTVGTGVVSLVVNNGTCDSNTATQNVTVNALPSTPDITGASSGCVGVQATYTTTSHSGYTYSWSVTGGSISGSSTGTSVNINWSGAGTGVISLTINNGTCDSNTATKNVTVLTQPTPSISGNNHVCIPNSGETYSTTNVSGHSYAWAVTGGTISSGQGTNSIIVNWSSAGSGTVNVNESNGTCAVDASTLNVTVYDKPDAAPSFKGPNSVYVSDTVIYYAPYKTDSLSYSWSINNGTIVYTGPNADYVKVQWGATAGTGTIYLANNNGNCDSDKSNISVTIKTNSPSTFSEKLAELAEARADRDNIYTLWRSAEEALASVNNSLSALSRQNKNNNSDAIALLGEQEQLEYDINRYRTFYEYYKTFVALKYTALHSLASYTSLVSDLDDACPILLSPVRLETKFKDEGTIGYYLMVRIFPDVVSVETHEDLLTENEYNAGLSYWDETLKSGATDNDKLGAWNALALKFSAQRAAWIALQTDPSTRGTNQELKYHSWSRQPEVRTYPDKFVAIVYKDVSGSYTELGQVTGNLVSDRLKVSVDPLDDDSLVVDEGTTGVGTDISLNDEIAWLSEFDTAVSNGMAFKINLHDYSLTSSQIDSGDFKVLVLGVKVSSTQSESKQLLEDLLLNHHYTKTGLGILKVGSETQNTKFWSAGYTTTDLGGRRSYALERSANLYAANGTDRYKTDGQWLAEYLGIDYDTLYHVENAGGYDMRNALLLNDFLWQSTLGYKLGNMLNGIVTRDQAESTRDYFMRYVSGRGVVPSIRVANIPYGILPVSVFTEWQWEDSESNKTYLDNMKSTVLTVRGIYSDKAAQVSYAGGSGNSQQDIMNAYTLQPVSTDYYHKVAVGPDYVWNQLSFYNNITDAQNWYSSQQTNANNAITALGFSSPSDIPRIFMLNYLDEYGKLTVPFAQAGVLSATASLKPNSSGVNYITWIANASLSDLKNENWGTGIEPPNTLLYYTLRYSMMLEYWYAGMKLLSEHGLVTEDEWIEPELMDITAATSLPEGVSSGDVLSTGKGRWDYLDRVETVIDPVLTIGQYLDSSSSNGIPAKQQLSRVKTDMILIADISSKDLDLAARESFDISSYRLDAWQLGMANQRLEKQRNLMGTTGSRHTGIYLGAYGWVWGLKPNTSRTMLPSGTVPGFNEEIEDPGNLKGHIHAPSVDHAKAGAVLKSAYQSTSDKKSEITLTSERVRTALQFIEGIRNGQTMAALLGYEFERGLHENHPGLELDIYIYIFRDAFKVQQFNDYPSDAAIETIAASDVVDGMKLYEQTRKYKDTQSTYDYGVGGLPTYGTPESMAIESELDRLAEIVDSISDLSITEGVFQLIRNNQEAASAVMEALQKGSTFPYNIQSIETPRTGKNITNRVAIHFDTITETGDNWAPMTIRALTEPYLNKYLGSVLSSPSKIICLASYTLNEGQTDEENGNAYISLEDLGINPIDVLYLYPSDLQNDDSELSLRIRYYVKKIFHLPGATDIVINYNPNLSVTFLPTGAVSFQDCLPLIKYLKKIVNESRYLKPDDYIMDESSIGNDNSLGFNLQEMHDRVYTAYTAFNSLISTITADIATVNTSGYTLTDLTNLRNNLLRASDYGIVGLVPMYADMNQDINNTIRDYLTDLAGKAINIMNQRITDIGSSWDAILLNVDINQRYSIVEEILNISQTLFDKSFIAFPLFKFYNQSEISAAYSNKADILPSGDPLVVDSWIQSTGKVRSKVAYCEMTEILSDALFDNNAEAFTPIQLPFSNDADNYKWHAVPHSPTVVMSGDVLSIVAKFNNVSTTINLDNYQCGIFIDEWVENIPDSSETTGIAFNYDLPNAKAPNSLLLAITPVETGSWSWSYLVKTINETIELAKQRAVDQDILKDSDFAKLMDVLYHAYGNYPQSIQSNVQKGFA